jgi:hypothetical protein
MKSNSRSRAIEIAAENAAEDALDALTLDDDDWTIAQVVAHWLVVSPGYKYHRFRWFGIEHDCRKRRPQNMDLWSERARRRYELHSGRCLLRLDWHHKNVAGIKTNDLEFARQWLVDALFFGYSPYRCHGAGGGGGGGGMGSIYAVRARITEKIERRFAGIHRR